MLSWVEEDDAEGKKVGGEVVVGLKLGDMLGWAESDGCSEIVGAMDGTVLSLGWDDGIMGRSQLYL